MQDKNAGWMNKILAPELRGTLFTKPINGRASIEEQFMIRGYILYPLIITMLQKSMSDLEFARISLKNVIVRCLEQIMFTVSDDFYALKRELKRRGIKVEEESNNDDVFYYRYYCRGTDERLGFTREALRTEVRTVLTSYTSDLGKELRGGTAEKELTH